MKQFVYLNRAPLKEGFPLRSLFYGEGVFETFRWRFSPPVFWKRHVERLKKGAAMLHIPFPGEDYLLACVEEAVSISGISDAYVKVCLLSCGSPVFYELPQSGSVLVTVRQYREPCKTQVRVCVSPFYRASTSPVSGIKSINYLENVIARRSALFSGFDEAVFLNEKGEVTEASASNIFWLKEGMLFTPEPSCGLLPGITRGITIESASELGIKVEEGRFDLDALLSSDGAFLTNSLVGVMPVAQIGNVFLPSDSSRFEVVRGAVMKKLNWL